MNVGETLCNVVSTIWAVVMVGGYVVLPAARWVEENLMALVKDVRRTPEERADEQRRWEAYQEAYYQLHPENRPPSPPPSKGLAHVLGALLGGTLLLVGYTVAAIAMWAPIVWVLGVPITVVFIFVLFNSPRR